MSPELQESIDRLLEGASGRCAPQRRSDTLKVVLAVVNMERQAKETARAVSNHNQERFDARQAKDERITALRQALDDRNTMMDNEADNRDKEAKRLQYRVDQARENEELASDEIMLLNEVVICQAKQIAQLVEDAK